MSATGVPGVRASSAGWYVVADPQATPIDLAEPPGLDVETHFAIVPEWVLDSPISDCALRLYAVLVRYGQTSGARVPGRNTLARRLRKQSVDTVDRAMKELVGIGAVELEHRRQGTRQLTNSYVVRTARPEGGRTDAATPGHNPALGPTDAAGQSRTSAAGPGRAGAAAPAAGVRPNPESLTQSSTPPPPRGMATRREEEADGNQQLLDACGIEDIGRFAEQAQQLRRDRAQPYARWAGPCLLAALQLAVKVRGWPAKHARSALLLVAADPATRSPMRLAEAGPWWDTAQRQTLQRTPQEQAEIDGLERLLAECDDRALLQQLAREQLTAEGVPLNRLSVSRRAARLLEQQNSRGAGPPQRPAAATRLSATTAMRRTA